MSAVAALGGGDSGAIMIILILLEWVSSVAEADPRGFTEDPFITEEKFREKVPTKEVTGVLGGRARIPCDLTAPFPSDSPHLILFYKDVFGTPIYSVDVRNVENPRHWRDNGTVGDRSFFKFHETGMHSETGAKVTDSFLGIDALRLEDRGVYRCRVDFKEAPTRNTRIKLNLIVPPPVPVVMSESGQVLHESTDPVREGSTITLVCESMGGDPLPRLTWWRGQSVVDDVVEEVDAKQFRVRNRLRLAGLERVDHGTTLTCRAANTNLTQPVRTVVKINMVFPPVRATLVHEWEFFATGQAYNVSCRVVGSRPPAATSVFVGTSQLREVGYQVSSDGNTSTTTVIFIPSEADQGRKLTCRGENMHLPASAVEDHWTVQVHFAPALNLRLVSSQDAENVQEGDSVQLKCVVKANPKAESVQWYYQDSTLSPGELEANVFLNDDMLTINKIQSHQKGNYQCSAQNNMGDGKSNNVNLDVKSVPSCSNPAGRILRVSTTLQETLELSCQMSNRESKNLEFRWTLNTSVDNVDIPRAQFSEHGHRSLLTYTPQTEMDFGTVTCLASNEVGETREKPCIFHIVPAGKPEGLKNCTVVNQTYESLAIVCQQSFPAIGEDNFVLEVYGAQSTSMVLNITTTSKPTFYLRGLSPGTEYFVEIYAANSRGRSERTLFETFTLQSAEKQLAATTTELASKGALRLLPIFGVLLAVVCVLVMLTVMVVFVLRGKTSRNGNVARRNSEGTTLSDFIISTAAAKVERNLRSPDVIPQQEQGYETSRFFNVAHHYQDSRLNRYCNEDQQHTGVVTNSVDRRSMGWANTTQQLHSPQYVELSFSSPGGENELSSSDVVNTEAALRRQEHFVTTYASIDHQRKRQLPHSPNCPSRSSINSLKSDRSQLGRSSTLPRSHGGGTYKRVAFKDLQEENEESFSLRSSQPPSPSWPINYTTFPQLSSSVVTQQRQIETELLLASLPPPPSGFESQLQNSILNCNSLQRHLEHQQQPTVCSPVKDVESSL